MKTLTVTCKKYNLITSALIDDELYDWLSQYNWYLSNGYPTAYIDGKQVKLHRLITMPPPGMEVDHLNGDRCDATRVNLKVCTRTRNARNKRVHKNSATGVRGVEMRFTLKGIARYVAYITIDGRKTQLGTFDTLQDAFRVRRQAEIDRGDGDHLTHLYRCFRFTAA